MCNGRRLLAVVFGCLWTAAVCLAEPDLSVAPSLLPEESSAAIVEPPVIVAPVVEPVVQEVAQQPSVVDALPSQPPSVHAGKTQEQLLAEIRDVYAPEKPDWWPLAPGWWLLGMLIALLVGSFVRWWCRYLVARRRHDWKKSAFAEHQRLYGLAADKSVPSTKIIADASVLMRRVSLAQFPREKIASLTDGQWLTALDGLSNTKAYSEGVGSLLTRHPYMRPHDIAGAELDELLKLIKSTINNAPSTLHHNPQRRADSQTSSMKLESGRV